MSINNDIVLVDASAWIETFKINGNKKIIESIETLVKKDKIATTGIVLFELLRGAANLKEYKVLEEELRYFKYLEFREEYWIKASLLSFELHKNGFRIPPPDIFISIVAIEHQCSVIHTDRHYDIISRYSPLKVYS